MRVGWACIYCTQRRLLEVMHGLRDHASLRCLLTNHDLIVSAAMVLDTREGLAEIVRFQLTDFPYSLCVVGTTALVGCGDGSLHVIDVAAGQRRYALGANQAAVRYMAASEGTLIAAGDDGNVLVYEFA